MTGIAFSPDGKTLASSGAEGVLLWDVDTGKLRATLDPGGYDKETRRHEFYIQSVAISPDGRYLAWSATNAMATLWDLKAERKIKVFQYEGRRTVNTVCFSPDSKTLVTGTGAEPPGYVDCWDIGDSK